MKQAACVNDASRNYTMEPVTGLGFRRLARRLWRCAMPCVLLVAAAAMPAVAGADGPRVAVTIKPVHSLVASLMDGIGAPVLLLEDAGSPHGFALKPSTVRNLRNADFIIRVSPALETFLSRQLDALPPGSRVITLADTPGLNLLPVRTGEHTARKEPHGQTAFHHDTHIWLDPRNAVTLARFLAQELIATAPRHKSPIELNLQNLITRLDSLDNELDRKLAPIRSIPFAVFHDAWQYFENRYRLNVVGFISLNPSLKPGARHILKIRERLKSARAVCIFKEPQFTPRLVTAIRQGTDIRAGTLDPLGAAISAGPDHYFTLMRRLAADLRRCLMP